MDVASGSEDTGEVPEGNQVGIPLVKEKNTL